MEQANDNEMLTFRVPRGASRAGPRLGELLHRDRPAIATPSFVACTSRGVVPHVTPDLLLKHTSISAVYIGLEDFLGISRHDPAILSIAGAGSALRDYISLPERYLSILGARRIPRLGTPHSNTDSVLSISTSFGFGSLGVDEHDNAIGLLKPDVATTAVDLVQADKISRKRLEKSADRTHAWFRDTIGNADKQCISSPLFASIPPLAAEQQSFYLSDLADDYKHELSGLCVYEHTTASAIPVSLRTLPVLCLDNPKGPHDLLHAIALGVDLITIPFVTAASEAGIALTFSFPPPSDTENGCLGIDMWSSSHQADLKELMPSCICYACKQHHRAFVNHLLQAKEMLAWTLLQIHNFHVLNHFFENVRISIAQGTFEEDSRAFRIAYTTEMPQQTGQGPRVRGYQVKSMGPGEPKKNSKAYNKLDEQARKIKEAEVGTAAPAPEADAHALEDQGLGQKLD